MTLSEQADRHRAVLLAAALDGDDDDDARHLPAVLDELSRRHGFDAGAALLFLLTGLSFDEQHARRHWSAILGDWQELRSVLARPVGLRTAVLDYFVNIHPHLDLPSLVDETVGNGCGEPEDARVIEPLPGAARFREWVDHEVRRARRYGGTVGLVLADLDDFAALNETLGREAGDRVLNEVGRRLAALVEVYDHVARPGDDEFALLLPGADRGLTATRAHRMQEAVEESVDLEGAPAVRIRVSVGLAVFPGDARSPDALLERAAQALYEAKTGGGARVVAWRPERRRQLRREGAGAWVAHVRAAHGPPERRVELCNLSREGVAFFSDMPFEVGASVEVRLSGSPDDDVARHGVVVHLDRQVDRDANGPRRGERDPAAGYRVGVAFDQLPGAPLRPPESGR